MAQRAAPSSEICAVYDNKFSSDGKSLGQQDTLRAANKTQEILSK